MKRIDYINIVLFLLNVLAWSSSISIDLCINIVGGLIAGVIVGVAMWVNDKIQREKKSLLTFNRMFTDSYSQCFDFIRHTYCDYSGPSKPFPGMCFDSFNKVHWTSRRNWRDAVTRLQVGLASQLPVLRELLSELKQPRDFEWAVKRLQYLVEESSSLLDELNQLDNYTALEIKPINNSLKNIYRAISQVAEVYESCVGWMTINMSTKCNQFERHNTIEERAHDIWVQEGKKEGCAEQHWRQAAAEFDELFLSQIHQKGDGSLVLKDEF